MPDKRKSLYQASNGKWSVTLDPLQAGGPYELTIEASPATEKKSKKKAQASQKLTYKEVLVGEVWLCSGQSNMAFRVDELADSQRKELLEYADSQPQIRLFNMQPRWYTNAVNGTFLSWIPSTAYNITTIPGGHHATNRQPISSRP